MRSFPRHGLLAQALLLIGCLPEVPRRDGFTGRPDLKSLRPEAREEQQAAELARESLLTQSEAQALLDRCGGDMARARGCVSYAQAHGCSPFEVREVFDDIVNPEQDTPEVRAKRQAWYDEIMAKGLARPLHRIDPEAWRVMVSEQGVSTVAEPDDPIWLDQSHEAIERRRQWFRPRARVETIQATAQAAMVGKTHDPASCRCHGVKGCGETPREYEARIRDAWAPTPDANGNITQAEFYRQLDEFMAQARARKPGRIEVVGGSHLGAMGLACGPHRYMEPPKPHQPGKLTEEDHRRTGLREARRQRRRGWPSPVEETSRAASIAAVIEREHKEKHRKAKAARKARRGW